MGSETEPAKLLLPYLQRADELQKHEPLVAYYGRLCSMERGLKIQAKERTKTTSSILVSLMNQVEKVKQTEESHKIFKSKAKQAEESNHSMSNGWQQL